MILPPPERIVYCYEEWQDIFSDYPNVHFQEGVPDFSQFDGKQRTLVIIDDLLSARQRPIKTAKISSQKVLIIEI
jgi:hypothetical protein